MINWRSKVILLAVMMCDNGMAHSIRAVGDMSSISAALKMFKVYAGRYPTEEEGLMALVEKPATYPENKRWQKIMDRPPLDPWNNPYHYILSEDLKDSHARPSLAPDGLGLYSFGPDGISNSKGNDADDWNSWDESSWDKRSFSDRLWDSPLVRYTGPVVGLIAGIALVRSWRGRGYQTP